MWSPTSGSGFEASRPLVLAFDLDLGIIGFVSSLGLNLQKHHVLALRSDRDGIAEALRPVPKTKRPRLHHENHAMVAVVTPDEGSSVQTTL